MSSLYEEAGGLMPGRSKAIDTEIIDARRQMLTEGMWHTLDAMKAAIEAPG